MHFVVGEATAEGRRPSADELDDIYERHYRETLAACRAGGFDALAHIDLPTRYLDGRREPAALIEEVLETMVAKGIALEVNTWSLRKGRAEGSPTTAIMDAYAACGGSFVTMGSDAHCASDVAACMTEAEIGGLARCFYRARKRAAA